MRWRKRDATDFPTSQTFGRTCEPHYCCGYLGWQWLWQCLSKFNVRANAAMASMRLIPFTEFHMVITLFSLVFFNCFSSLSSSFRSLADYIPFSFAFCDAPFHLTRIFTFDLSIAIPTSVGIWIIVAPPSVKLTFWTIFQAFPRHSFRLLPNNKPDRSPFPFRECDFIFQLTHKFVISKLWLANTDETFGSRLKLSESFI